MIRALACLVTGLAAGVLSTAPPLAAGALPTPIDLVQQAGFQMIRADTPEKLAKLEQLTPTLVVVPREYKGEPVYTLADPYGCKCLYVGRQAEYVRYRQLSSGARLEQETPRPMAPTTFEWEYLTPGLNW
ncbi:MAG TPA: hypothetical protein VF406_05600 [Thermodesulfobacteriota bacterium]